MSLTLIAALSGIYDLSVGLVLLTARGWLAHTMGVPLPVPPIHVDLNALFLLTIGAGYWLPYTNPDRYRAYLWLMGPMLKGAGAAVFIIDRLVRDSPDIFLLFAASDGAVAALTLWALVSNPPRSSSA